MEETVRFSRVAGRRPRDGDPAFVPDGLGHSLRRATLAALACVDGEHAREFVEAELGQLANGYEHSRRFMATLCFHLEENMSPLRARSARGYTSLNPMRSGRLRSGGDRFGFGPRERDGQLPA
jgi:hypothetical protein